MDTSEVRVRRRGFVVIPTEPNVDDELESAEGLRLRVRLSARLHRRPTGTSSRIRDGLTIRALSRRSTAHSLDASAFDPDSIRSTNGTGIRQRSHWHR